MGLFRKKKNGKTAKEWRDKGDALYKLKKYQAAIDCYDKALEIDPKYTRAWFNKGLVLYYGLEKYQAAIDCYDKALKIDPKHTLAWYEKGYALYELGLYELGKYQAAIDCYDKALEIDPKYAYAWYYKGSALYRLKKYQAAIDCFGKVLEIDPKHYVAWNIKGEALYELGKYQAAIDCFDKALGIKPDYIRAWQNKNRAKKEKEDADAKERIKAEKTKDLRSRLKEVQGKFVISQPLHAQIKRFEEGDHEIDINNLERLLDKVESTMPEIELSLKDKNFRLNRWGDLKLEIRNNSIAHAFNLIPSFSDDIEVRRIKPITVKGKESIVLELAVKAKISGRIPLDIKTQFEDAKGNKHEKLHEAWVEASEDVKEEIRPAEFIPAPTTPSTFPAELQAKYRDVKYLSKGGFARVFRANKISDGRTVALKVALSLDEATGKSFLKEIKAWEELSHENIIQLYDVNIMPIPYFEMEYADKGTLEGLSKPVEAEEAARIILEILSGLKYAHDKGIIHRDLKPQNVLLAGDSTAKISDWGLSKVMAESKSSSITGFSPLYATPEQVAPKQFGRPDPKTDIYQVGVIFYELVTGRLPFKGDSIEELSSAIVGEEPDLPSEINPDAKDVEPIIIKCLKKKKEDRYQTAAELQKVLAGYLKLQLTQSLKKSSSSGDLTRSRLFCTDLVLLAAKQGDCLELLKHLSLLQGYAKEEEKAEIESLIKQISYRKEQGMEMNEELLSGIKVLIYQVQMK